MGMISILIAILLLGILIAIHELGHFAAARLTGIEVKAFSIGVGPKIVGWTGKNGTEYTLRWIPMGGYCAFYGEDDPNTTNDPRDFGLQAVWKRLLTVISGPVMNFVLAFVVVCLFFWIGGQTVVTGYLPVVQEVEAGSPAETAQMQAGDVILTMDGTDVTKDPSLISSVLAQSMDEQPVAVVVSRGEEQVALAMVPFYDEALSIYRMGVTLRYTPLTEEHPCTLPQAVSASWDWCGYASTAIISSLKNLVTTGEGLEDTSGPVGIITTVSQEVRTGGFQAFLSLLSVISINLGIMNLLPIPGLDGSRVVFLLIEAIARKPVPRKIEAYVHLCGFALLLGLMLFFTWNDLVRLFH